MFVSSTVTNELATALLFTASCSSAGVIKPLLSIPISNWSRQLPMKSCLRNEGRPKPLGKVYSGQRIIPIT